MVSGTVYTLVGDFSAGMDHQVRHALLQILQRPLVLLAIVKLIVIKVPFPLNGSLGNALQGFRQAFAVLRTVLEKLQDVKLVVAGLFRDALGLFSRESLSLFPFTLFLFFTLQPGSQEFNMEDTVIHVPRV